MWQGFESAMIATMAMMYILVCLAKVPDQWNTVRIQPMAESFAI